MMHCHRLFHEPVDHTHEISYGQEVGLTVQKAT